MMEQIQVGQVGIVVVNARGFTPEELAEQALKKLIHIPDQIDDPKLAEQAQAAKDKVMAVLIAYLKEAVNNDRATTANMLCAAGYSEAAALIKRI